MIALFALGATAALPDLEVDVVKGISTQMHDAWCTGENRLLNADKGPCMKHALVQAAEAGMEEEKIGALHAAIDEKISKELGAAQLNEMHQWFCGRKDAVEAPGGSALRTFCAARSPAPCMRSAMS